MALFAGIPIALSTLTFKQHYVADVVSGLALGMASWWLCFRWTGLRLTRSGF
ncbi:MAG TPA: phosphatase PAP2 family protein [Steroidobacteraceae bacterium]|nr:phosphatase PAP2 family protein [Steroidobacteraceae bacterium]